MRKKKNPVMLDIDFAQARGGSALAEWHRVLRIQFYVEEMKESRDINQGTRICVRRKR